MQYQFWNIASLGDLGLYPVENGDKRARRPPRFSGVPEDDRLRLEANYFLNNYFVRYLASDHHGRRILYKFLREQVLPENDFQPPSDDSYYLLDEEFPGLWGDWNTFLNIFMNTAEAGQIVKRVTITKLGEMIVKISEGCIRIRLTTKRKQMRIDNKKIWNLILESNEYLDNIAESLTTAAKKELLKVRPLSKGAAEVLGILSSFTRFNLRGSLKELRSPLPLKSLNFTIITDWEAKSRPSTGENLQAKFFQSLPDYLQEIAIRRSLHLKPMELQIADIERTVFDNERYEAIAELVMAEAQGLSISGLLYPFTEGQKKKRQSNQRRHQYSKKWRRRWNRNWLKRRKRIWRNKKGKVSKRKLKHKLRRLRRSDKKEFFARPG